jgi:hypothetical protein
VITSSQRPLPENTHHTQQTHIHAPGVICTHDHSGRAALDLPLRPRGHWDWRITEHNFLQKLVTSLVSCNSVNCPPSALTQSVLHVTISSTAHFMTVVVGNSLGSQSQTPWRCGNFSDKWTRRVVNSQTGRRYRNSRKLHGALQREFALSQRRD